jgi:hypothetical protein
MFVLIHLIIFICSFSDAVPVVDNATQHLLEENIQLLSQISANIETLKVCMKYFCLLSLGINVLLRCTVSGNFLLGSNHPHRWNM